MCIQSKARRCICARSQAVFALDTHAGKHKNATTFSINDAYPPIKSASVDRDSAEVAVGETIFSLSRLHYCSVLWALQRGDSPTYCDFCAAAANARKGIG